MDKVLRLYKIPESDYIIRVIAVTDTAPSSFSEGDLYINTSTNELYEAQESGGVVSWVNIAWDSSKYYLDTSTQVPMFYKYDDVNNEPVYYPVDFPASGRAAEIYDFTYSSNRMGNAPTISAKLESRMCLDELWTDRVCVYFNKVFYFIDKIPTSEYSNAEERYKHTLELVSERKLLENVYFVNVVDLDSSDIDLSSIPAEWLEFTDNCNIAEFVARLNESLAYSSLDSTHIGFNVVIDQEAITYINQNIDEPYKNVSISDTTLKAALDMIYELWDVPYYFDGYVIHIGFSNESQMPYGTEMPTFQYGAVQSLLSLQKSQSNEIVNRITGFGSETNIPYFYPNKNPNALELQYERNSTLMIDYAKIANPYKLVNVEATDEVHQGVPNGSYFKFMPIQKTRTYDQFSLINPNKIIGIDENSDGVLSLVETIQQDEDVNMVYQCFAPYGDGTKVAVIKKMFIWFGDKNPSKVTIKDHTDTFPFQRKCTSGEFVATPLVCTREQWEAMSEGNLGYTYGTPRVQLTYNHTVSSETVGGETVYTDNYAWSDGTATEGYDDKFPLELTNIPSSYKGFLVVHTIYIPYNAVWFGEIDSPVPSLSSEWRPYLKNNTRASVVIEYSGDNDWSLNASGYMTPLYRYGIKLNAGVTPAQNDLIYFTKEAGAMPRFDRLMPYSYRETGDIWLNAINSHYLKNGSQSSYYVFENLYKISCAKEHVENFDDIKPTIKGISNNQSTPKRIDKIVDIAFDQDDNNDKNSDGQYVHPYFFVKLAQTSVADGFGFNLFDCAIEGSSMTINMADGYCSGCNFEVMVKYGTDGMARNPVGVFDEATTINGVTYAAGTPRRNLQTGDVLLNRNEEQQQDTSTAEVWIALKKDNQTFGENTVLPDGSLSTLCVATGDRFTIVNINLPYAYIVEAEKRLYYALLDYMEAENKRKWSFSIKFSSVYYKQHFDFMDRWLNESSKVPFIYNGIERSYYVLSYNYKMSANSPLPEVTIELQEKARKKSKLIIPVTPNSQQNMISQAVTDAIKALKVVNSGNSVPDSLEVNNIQILGELTLGNGVNVNSQISEINSQLLDNLQAQTQENAWHKVKEFAESENMFVDGLFVTDENKYSSNKVSVTALNEGIYGKDGINISFEDSDSFLCFEQKIFVEELNKYTIVFFAKSSTMEAINVNLTYYDDNDDEIEEGSIDYNVSLESKWNKVVILTSSPPDSYYAKITISKPAS